MDLPSNFHYFLYLFQSTMFPLPNISLKIVNWMIIKFNSSELPIQTPPQKFDDQGLSALFLVNGFSIDLYLILSIILTLLVNLLYKILTKIDCKYLSKLKNAMKWSFSIRFLIENYKQLSMGALLQLYHVNFQNKYSMSSYILAIITLVLLLVFPLICGKCLAKRRNGREKMEFKEKYEILFEQYRHTTSKFNKYFIVFLLLRKILFIGNLVLLYNKTFLNLLILTIQSVIWFILLMKYRPYIEKKQNILGIHEELTFITINIILIVLFYQEIEENTVNNIGIVLIVLGGILISAQLISSLYDNFKIIEKICKSPKKTTVIKK